jgi:hypothetical protein
LQALGCALLLSLNLLLQDACVGRRLGPRWKSGDGRHNPQETSPTWVGWAMVKSVFGLYFLLRARIFMIHHFLSEATGKTIKFDVGILGSKFAKMQTRGVHIPAPNNPRNPLSALGFLSLKSI